MYHLPRHHALNELEIFPVAPIYHESQNQFTISLRSLLVTSPLSAYRHICASCTIESDLAFCIQHCFYFQLLSEITGRHLYIDDWTRLNEEQVAKLDTGLLETCLQDWRRTFLESSFEIQEWKIDYITRLLKFTTSVCKLFEHDRFPISASDSVIEDTSPASSQILQVSDEDPPLSSVMFSIRILIATIHIFVNSVWPRFDDLLSDFCPSLSAILSLDDRRMKKLVEVGWCPHQVQTFWKESSCVTAMYLLSLPRSHDSKERHWSCMESPICVANVSSTSQSQLLHIRKDCDCIPVDSSEEEVVRIIRQGQVPLVRIRRTECCKLLRISIVPRTTSSRYVAVSHIWSDGLGNPEKNSLSQCVLTHLLHRLDTMPRSFNPSQFEVFGRRIDWPRQSFLSSVSDAYPLFWMDALCVPVADMYKEVRQLAINQMASIYAGAEQVLILDAELQNYQAGSASAVETLGAIVNSNWMTRAWTLQEGSLGRECVFQFADIALDPINSWSLGGPRNVRSKHTDIFPSKEDVLYDWLYKSLYNIMWDKTRQNWKHSLQKEGNFRHLQTGKHLRAQEARQYTGLKRVMVQEHKATHKPLETYFETLDSEEARCKQLVSVWNELIHRSTSKPEDLHTIIANLLDFHVKNLQQIQTLSESMGTVMSLEQIKAARMRAILLSFSALPLSLLIQRGSHLQPQALSWVQTVPETPLDNSDDMMHIEESEVVIVPGAIRHHSVRILQGHLPENGMLHFRDEKTGLVYSGEIDKLSPTHLWRYPPTFCIIYHTLKRTGALLQITHYSRKRADKTSSAGDYKLHALYLGRVELRIDVSSLSSAVREVYEIPDGWTIGVGIGKHELCRGKPWALKRHRCSSNDRQPSSPSGSSCLQPCRSRSSVVAGALSDTCVRSCFYVRGSPVQRAWRAHADDRGLDGELAGNMARFSVGMGLVYPFGSPCCPPNLAQLIR